MKQPQFRDDVSTLAMPPRQTETGNVPGISVPSLSQSSQFCCAGRRPWYKMRNRGHGKRNRFEIGCERSPKPPHVGWDDVDADAARRQNAVNFGVYASKIRYVLKHV